MNKKIIDFHSHVFPDRLAALAIKNLADSVNATPFFDGSVNGLRENMKKNNIDLSVCLPIVTNPRHTKTINDYAIEINNKYDDIISFGGIHPNDENYKNEIIRLKENGIKGIKLHPVFQKVSIDNENYVNIINYAISEGLYVVIHAGLDPGFPGDMSSSVENMVKMLDKVEDTSKIILAHLGGLFQWEEAMEKIVGRNLYLDTAMCFNEIIHADGTITKLIDDDLFLKIVEKHGSDKILLGSDNPWTPSGEAAEYIKNLKIANKDIVADNILYKNALKILNME